MRSYFKGIILTLTRFPILRLALRQLNLLGFKFAVAVMKACPAVYSVRIRRKEVFSDCYPGDSDLDLACEADFSPKSLITLHRWHSWSKVFFPFLGETRFYPRGMIEILEQRSIFFLKRELFLNGILKTFFRHNPDRVEFSRSFWKTVFRFFWCGENTTYPNRTYQGWCLGSQDRISLLKSVYDAIERMEISESPLIEVLLNGELPEKKVRNEIKEDLGVVTVPAGFTLHVVPYRLYHYNWCVLLLKEDRLNSEDLKRVQKWFKEVNSVFKQFQIRLAFYYPLVFDTHTLEKFLHLDPLFNLCYQQEVLHRQKAWVSRERLIEELTNSTALLYSTIRTGDKNYYREIQTGQIEVIEKILYASATIDSRKLTLSEILLKDKKPSLPMRTAGSNSPYSIKIT